jgi:hypothetical protein
MSRANIAGVIMVAVAANQLPSGRRIWLMRARRARSAVAIVVEDAGAFVNIDPAIRPSPRPEACLRKSHRLLPSKPFEHGDQPVDHA